ncbi:hypothetical protein [Xenorhabdus lircayensis]|uniref:Uncharacterized protein n=1 Tax=Xenorhabdus lircayensis TaxID=2763499 RepID=A0ABS0U037_9GAMM|nr:hypothetical protein [Xenorhabdus lircayensis]MBI6547231.1 hypothetical protein [Xenorhabdus lircayensis]
MNSNDKPEKSVTDKMAKDDDTIVQKAIITGLETDISGNNIEVKFKDPYGGHYENFYLAYPNQQVSGGGIYLTLLSSLANSFTVSLKLTEYVYPEGNRYISGVNIESPGIPPDPYPPWG